MVFEYHSAPLSSMPTITICQVVAYCVTASGTHIKIGELLFTTKSGKTEYANTPIVAVSVLEKLAIKYNKIASN